MRKFTIIIVLALIQCACATPQAVPSANLLSFDAIEAEISVSYEDLSEQFDPTQTVALADD